MDDPVIQRIESFRCRRGPLLAERRSHGYMLYHASSGTPVARLRPAESDDRVEVLCWSLWKERRIKAGPFARTLLSIDDALRFIAMEDIFSGLYPSRACEVGVRAQKIGSELDFPPRLPPGMPVLLRLSTDVSDHGA